jgi:hypothetical protein
VFSEEELLLVIHLVWELSKPGDRVGRWPGMACRRWRQVDAECDTDRPVHPSLEVARVLDVSEETVDNHVDRELLFRHSVDGNINGSPKRTAPPGLCQRPWHGPAWRRASRTLSGETMTASTVSRGTLA